MSDMMTAADGEGEQAENAPSDLMDELQEDSDSLLGRFQQRFPFWGAVGFWVGQFARMGKYWVLGGLGAFVLTSLITLPVFGVEPIASSVTGVGQMFVDAGAHALEGGMASPWNIWFYAVGIYAIYLVKAEAKRFYALYRNKRELVDVGSGRTHVSHLSDEEDWSGKTWQELLAYSTVALVVGGHALAMSLGFTPQYLEGVPMLAVWVVFLAGVIVVAWATTRTIDEDIEHHGLNVEGSTFWLLGVRVPLLYCAFALVAGAPVWLDGMFTFVPAVVAPLVGLAYVVRRQFQQQMISARALDAHDLDD